MSALDRKTHDLIRLACAVGIRNPSEVERQAMFAASKGATWEEVAETVVLTQPAFGSVGGFSALGWARKGYERGSAREPRTPGKFSEGKTRSSYVRRPLLED
jgi:alkylhydroperoxidase/carboxymuconolactone decarboxylase family protein YurZ